ncbi:ABC transporter permease [Streptomyces sp. ISL-100]|uniref:ABC transporter permease n=1 Tax=Streptomyces sp. ISL-100 TaxID=2819173 RepID=UPI001BEB3DB7|nr:FtsX-like permease family protein [Streptomyces sp. ISL-100]MBT2397306.1 ABC transporter permease [Streptomyces sp. ISL-100]
MGDTGDVRKKGQKAVAPWVRTRLRSAPGPAVALVLLVLLTSALAAAFPRAVDTYEDRGLRHAVSTASAHQSVVELTTDLSDPEIDPSRRHESARPALMAEQYGKARGLLPDGLAADAAQSAYGVRTIEPFIADDPWLPRPDGLPPKFSLSSQSGLPEHSRLREGRLPRAEAGTVTGRTRAVEAAVTAATAKSLRLKVGSTVHVGSPLRRGALAVTVTGIVEPRLPELSYWSFEPLLRTPGLQFEPGGGEAKRYWVAALLLAPDAAPVIFGVDPSPELYWRFAPRADGLTAAGLPGLRTRIASLEHGPDLARMRAEAVPDVSVDSRLDDVLASFSGSLGAIDPVVAVGAFGVGTVAAVVLLMAGGLAAARRSAELALLRSRGGSVRGIGGRLLAETAVLAVPAGAGGWALAALLLPEGRALAAALASGAVALIACCALPLRAVYVHRRLRVHGGRDDLVHARPSRRRTVAELTLLVLAAGAVAALCRRGAGSGQVDQLISAAPVLVGVIAALVLVRLYPLPLRLAARPMARRRGAIGFLALARAGRSPATAALPLLALLTALTTAAFGGSVLAGIADARERASTLAVGADARISGLKALPPSLTGAVREVAGVREVTPVLIDHDLDLRDGQGSVTLVAVEPESYARLARRTGLGAFPPEILKRPGGSSASAGPVRAIASPSVARRLGAGTTRFSSLAGDFDVRVSAQRPTTPALPDEGFLLVNAAELDRPPSPNTLLVTGDGMNTAAVSAAVRESGKDIDVKFRSEERAALADSPLQAGAGRVCTAAVAAGAGYAVLAVLLSLLQTVPERRALLARLRTMGLTRAQGRRLLVVESLPQALLAAFGGALVGWAAIRLLGPGLDLAELAMAAPQPLDALGPVRLRTDPWSLLLPACAVVAIAAAVATVQAWWTTRLRTTTELRAGDAT